MDPSFKEYTIWNAVTPQTLTSSTDASPVVLTKVAHGYVTGDKIIINGHTTNTTVNGIFNVVKLSADTFSLKDVNTGVAINGAGGGAGASGVMAIAPAVIFVGEYTNINISVETSGSANFTFKCAGSLGKLLSDVTSGYGDCPNFGGTQSKSNPYTFLQTINYDTAAAVNGATGITSAGTDLHNQYEININRQKWFTVVPTAWSAGALTVKAIVSTNQ